MWLSVTSCRRCEIFILLLRFARREMYIGHGRLCVYLSVPLRIPTLLRAPGCKFRPSGNGRVCSLVVHYWADLQSVHRFRCYDNVAPNAKCQRVLVLAVYLVVKRVAVQCINFNRSSFVCLRTALSPCRASDYSCDCACMYVCFSERYDL